MPPPHLAVLNPQNADSARDGERPARGLLAGLRASVAASFERNTAGNSRPRLLKAPPLLDRPIGPAARSPPDAASSPPEDTSAHATIQPAPATEALAGPSDFERLRPTLPPAQRAHAPLQQAVAFVSDPRHSFLVREALVIDDARDVADAAAAVAPPTPEPLPMAKPRPPRDQEDLLADLPPAQVPLRINVAALAFSAPAPRPVADANGARPPAAERAFRTGRRGARPAHAMSAVEIAAWREGAMEAGRARDPVFGLPRLWWWLALSLILVLPLAYAAGWLGLAGSGAEFLSTPVGQEAWILMGGPDAAWLYWGLLLVVALGVQFLRPLEPVLIVCAATWWGWTALHAAWVAGWLAQRIPPLPMPG